MKLKTIQEIDEDNADAAFKFLSDPEKYAGIQLEWAQLRVEKHKKAEAKPPPRRRTIRERLEAHDKRKAKKAVQHRYERWKNRKWKLNEAGNPYTLCHHCRIVVFNQAGRWKIAITDLLNNETTFSQKTYATADEAKDAAFTALLYVESRRKNADPRLAFRLPDEEDLCKKANPTDTT